VKCTEFAQTVSLGMTASAWRGYPDEPRITGRIVALTVPRYGAWILDTPGNEPRYFDSVWIDRLERASQGNRDGG
jgi:hypothetical protein